MVPLDWVKIIGTVQYRTLEFHTTPPAVPPTKSPLMLTGGVLGNFGVYMVPEELYNFYAGVIWWPVEKTNAILGEQHFCTVPSPGSSSIF